MKKIISLFYSRFLSCLLLILITGCAYQSGLAPQPPAPRGYHSDLADSEAKALFSYAEFRLLAVDNRWDEAIEALQRAVAFDPAADFLRMNLAKALLHNDQAEASIELLQQILQRSPNNIEGRELLGDLLGYQNKNEAAVEQYRLALELDPENDMLQMRLAMTLGRLGRDAEAIDLLETLVSLQPDAKMAQLSLARFYIESGQLDKAKERFEILLEQHPDLQQAVLEFGTLLEQQNLFADAFSLYREGIRQNPRAAEIRQQLSFLYLRQNRKAEALEQLLFIEQLVPGNPQILGRVGLLHLDMEAWADAENDFRKLLEQGENAGRNRYYLGLSLLGQQKYEEALQVMAPIDASSPVFSEAVMQLAYLYRQVGDLDQAISALQRLLEQDIQKPEIYYYLTSFYADAGQVERATQTVDKGLVAFPNNVELLYQAAVLHEKQGHREKALEVMQQILSVDPNHAEALNFVAYHHAENGTELELALTKVQQAMAAKRTGYIIDTLGWIYFKMGRYEESRQQLEEANHLLPEDAVILEHLGDLYRALNFLEKAAAAYAKSLELDPQAEGVAEKLQQLSSEHPQ